MMTKISPPHHRWPMRSSTWWFAFCAPLLLLLPSLVLCSVEVNNATDSVNGFLDGHKNVSTESHLEHSVLPPTTLPPSLGSSNASTETNQSFVNSTEQTFNRNVEPTVGQNHSDVSQTLVATTASTNQNSSVSNQSNHRSDFAATLNDTAHESIPSNEQNVTVADQSQETQICSSQTTTLFVNGEILDSNGVPITDGVSSNSTSSPSDVLPARNLNVNSTTETQSESPFPKDARNAMPEPLTPTLNSTTTSRSKESTKESTAKSSNTTSKPEPSRRIQLVEIKPGFQLLESHPDSVTKTLRIGNLFNNQSRSIELQLSRLADAQWQTDFFQLSHYLITNTDKLGFFKVSLEEIFKQSVHGMPNLNYHRLITNHTNLYVTTSSDLGPGQTGKPNNNSTPAVLLISRLGSYVEIYGLLNDHLMITPLWRHRTTVVADDGYGYMAHGAVKRGEVLNQFYTDPNSGSLLHALIDLNGDSIGRHMGFDVGVLLQQIKVHLSLSKKGTRGAGTDQHDPTGSPQAPPLGPQGADPNTIYPEVSLLIDYWAYRNHGRNVDELWRYMVIYFTRIDLIFRQLSSPSIRLRLRDIFIATRPFRFQNAEPHLGPNLARNQTFGTNQTTPTRPYLNSLKAINELGVYFYTEPKTFANSDLMLVITGQDLCADSTDSAWASAGSHYDTCTYATIKGQSFVGGACRADQYRHRKLNVAIVEDSGYFDGVLVASHELGHLMGSVHDGQWPINGILGPGGRGCASSRGNLMSQTGSRGFVPSYNQFRWSLCSVEQIAYFARLPSAVCLYNRPAY